MISYEHHRRVDDQGEWPLIRSIPIILVDVISHCPETDEEDNQSMKESLNYPLQENVRWKQLMLLTDIV